MDDDDDYGDHGGLPTRITTRTSDDANKSC